MKRGGQWELTERVKESFRGGDTQADTLEEGVGVNQGRGSENLSSGLRGSGWGDNGA